MNIINTILYFFSEVNIENFFNNTSICIIYSIFFLILFLENSFLPLSFLPGDTLLILIGILIAKKNLSFFIALIIFSTASGLGYWVGYLQGKFFRKIKKVKKWFSYFFLQYQKRTYKLFKKYGLLALLIGRFFAFIRTLLPLIVGLSKINNLQFQIFNWISAILWNIVLISFGFFLEKILIFQKYENYIILFLIFVPLTIGILLSIYSIFYKSKN